MSYSYTEHTGNGTQVTYPFTFSGRDKGYIKASDVYVAFLINGAWVNQSSGWSLSGTNQITFTVAPANGQKMRIRRIVDKEQPYAEFSRNVALDMNSLNNSFIHLLEISQELLDGFWPEGYFVKQNLNMGGFRIINLANGVDAGDAVNKGQMDAVDNKHTTWNQQQDQDIESIKASLTTGVANRTVPWYATATAGQTTFTPPFTFEGALVYINGVFQEQLNGAFTIANNTITFSEGLREGDTVYALLGSTAAAPVPGFPLEYTAALTEGQTVVNIATSFSRIDDVYLDGLHQPKSAYTVTGSTLVFTEPVPACTLLMHLYT